MRYRAFPFAFLLVAALPLGPARAQQSPSLPGGVLRQVIPNPTGKNGYEELIFAGELVRSSERFKKVEDDPSSATLSVKRWVLQDKPVVQALAILRQGLKKPVFEPRDHLDASTLLPEFQLFRQTARLLALQHYVLMADGKTSEAIDNTAETLALGRAVQTSTLIAGLVGNAIDAIALRAAGDSLDQLSARDCERLYQVCLDRLAQPSPLSRIMDAERNWVAGELPDQIRKQGSGALKDLVANDNSPNEETINEHLVLQEAQRQADSSAQAREQLAGELERSVNEFFTRVQAELRKPAWLRRFPQASTRDGSLGARLTGVVTPSVERASDTFTRDDAQVRLTACHCAIHRYRWEFGRWPASLDELNLGQLAVDPFSGKQLTYLLRDGRYKLTSIGAPAPSDDPKAVDGRRPVGVTAAD